MPPPPGYAPMSGWLLAQLMMINYTARRLMPARGANNYGTQKLYLWYMGLNKRNTLF